MAESQEVSRRQDSPKNDRRLTTEEFRARLQEIGEERYHHRHPFHLLMHEGKLTRGQVQAWALNRYYYQSRIPMKDAIILSRSEDPEFRRGWRKRIVDHDGAAAGQGGIERWLRLAEATGLDREQVIRCEGVLPGTRFAVDAYLELVRSHSFLEAVASSFTELFSPTLISLRMEKLKAHYPWIAGALDYFEARLTQAPEDIEFAFHWVNAEAKTRAEQELAMAALRRKCDILWSQLDALYYSYVQPGWPPPGAYRVKE